MSAHMCGLRDFEGPKCAIWMTCKALVYLLLTWGSDFPVKSWTCFPWWSSIAAAPFQNKRVLKQNQPNCSKNVTTPPVDADAWSFQSLHHQCCWNCHYWYYYLGGGIVTASSPSSHQAAPASKVNEFVAPRLCSTHSHCPTPLLYHASKEGKGKQIYL